MLIKLLFLLFIIILAIFLLFGLFFELIFYFGDFSVKCLPEFVSLAQQESSNLVLGSINLFEHIAVIAMEFFNMLLGIPIHIVLVLLLQFSKSLNGFALFFVVYINAIK